MRKSTESEEKQVMSIEAQLTELEQFAQKERLKIKERFIESKSAKNPGRMQFNRMLEMVYDSKEPIGILAWHPDRLARNSVDGGQIVHLIDVQKIQALKFPTFWFEPTPQGLFMLQVAFGQSKYYSDNLAENVKRGIRQKLRRGEWIGKAPLGYINNRRTKNIEPDPIKSKIIRKIFEEFAYGDASVDSLRFRLKFYGIVSKGGKAVEKSSVYWILRNPLYMGMMKYKDDFFQGNFEPLVSNEVFEAVQDRLSENSRPRKSKHRHDFPFTGLLECKECGCMITAQYAKGGKYIYYRCSKKRGVCSQSYLSADSMYEQLRAQLLKVSLPHAWIEPIFNQVKKWEDDERRGLLSFVQNLEISITETQMKLDTLVNGFLDGIIDRDIYLMKKEKLIKDKIRLEEQRKDFGQKGKQWVELLREWLELTHNAGKLAFSTDFYEIKSVMEKIGTNRHLENKKVGLNFVRPFDILLRYKGLARGGAACGGGKRKGEAEKITTSPVMWS